MAGGASDDLGRVARSFRVGETTVTPTGDYGDELRGQIQPRERAIWAASWRLAAPSLEAAEDR